MVKTQNYQNSLTEANDAPDLIFCGVCLWKPYVTAYIQAFFFKANATES